MNVMRRVFKGAARCTMAFARFLSSISKKSEVLDRAMAMGTTLGILGYRRFLSPIKGYRCAYARTTGGPSCSDVALDAFRSSGFSEGLKSTERQFYRCHAVAFGELPDAVDQAIRNFPNIANGGYFSMEASGSCCPCPPTGQIDP